MHVNPLDAGHFASYQWLSTNPKHQYYTSSTLIRGARFAVKCKLVIPEVDIIHVLTLYQAALSADVCNIFVQVKYRNLQFSPFSVKFFLKRNLSSP